MKNNKKGFTLIELLAVIVILAIIMVIAVPQILKVIDDARASSWKDSVHLVEKAVELNITLIDPQTGNSKASVKSLCTPVSPKTVSDNFADIVDIGDMTVSCSAQSNDATITLTGTGQFANDSYTGTLSNCHSSNGCSVVVKKGNTEY